MLFCAGWPCGGGGGGACARWLVPPPVGGRPLLRPLPWHSRLTLTALPSNLRLHFSPLCSPSFRRAVFAFGCIMYEVMTRQLLSDSIPEGDVDAAMEYLSRVSWSGWRPDLPAFLPKELRLLISLCWHRVRRRRRRRRGREPDGSGRCVSLTPSSGVRFGDGVCLLRHRCGAGGDAAESGGAGSAVGCGPVSQQQSHGLSGVLQRRSGAAAIGAAARTLSAGTGRPRDIHIDIHIRMTNATLGT